MNSLAAFHEAPTDEQDASYWLTVRGNYLPAPFWPGIVVVRHDLGNGDVLYGTRASNAACGVDLEPVWNASNDVIA